MYGYDYDSHVASHYDGEDKLRELLVGHKIVKAELMPKGYYQGAELTLDSGIVLEVVGNEGGCACSAGDYEVTKVATVDNIITDVRLADDRPEEAEDKWHEDAHVYRVFVITANGEIAAATIEGDDGNGYYGTGYYIYIKK